MPSNATVLMWIVSLSLWMMLERLTISVGEKLILVMLYILEWRQWLLLSSHCLV